ncbi:MAG TPA: beta-galactosidase, partial [Clostridia bacterium]|nr:beta-galactosidase [Clostridia bacterium]
MGIRAKRNLGATRYIAQDNNNDRFINFWFANYTRKNKRESLAELDRYFDKFKPNSLDVWVCWYWVERVRGKYDFSAYDKLIDKIASYGAKVFLRINAMDMPAWLYKVKDEKGRCIYTQWNYYGEDIVGTSYTGGKRAGIISYANPTSRKFVLDFTYAVVSHFKERYADHPQGNPIRMYGSCFSHSGEMEYDYEEKCGDYSPAAIKSFRKWLYNRYADISLLNERWRTAYSSFDEVEAPEITNNTQTVKEMDWLQYRAYEQGNMARLQREAIKKADPNAEYVLVFGSVFDPMIKRRGSLFADYWTEYTDWYGVADCFAYNHRYSMSFVRGISKGRKFYNEAFKEVKDNEKLRFEWLKMTRESFEEGANQMNYAGFPFEDVGKDEYDYYLVAADFIRDKSKVTRPAPKRAIYVSTWSAARDTASVCAEAERVFDELRKDGFIDVIRDGTFESDPE